MLILKRRRHRALPMLSLLTMLLSAGLPLSASAAPADNCQLQISNPQIDYGNVTRPELAQRQISPLQTSMGKQSLTLSAICRQPVAMTVFFRGIAADGGGYRFGKMGSFLLTLSNARLDGKAVNLGRVKAAGQAPESIDSKVLLSPNEGIAPLFNAAGVKGSSFSVQVEVEARIPLLSSRIADEAVWRGNGNFELLEN